MKNRNQSIGLQNRPFKTSGVIKTAQIIIAYQIQREWIPPFQYLEACHQTVMISKVSLMTSGIEVIRPGRRTKLERRQKNENKSNLVCDNKGNKIWQAIKKVLVI